MGRGLIAVLALGFGLCGCAVKPGPDGRAEPHFDPRYLAKTDIDRVVDASREQVMEGLFRVADKLYRRNPREWRKAGLTDREAALARLRDYRHQAPAELAGQREGAAAIMAFSPEYPGDRVAALMYGLLTMVDAAYAHKDEFFILDALDEQKLYNCARNMEIAVWKLAAAKDAAGEALLLSNEIGAGQRNLSFEREFGRIIGLLDFMSKVVADKNGRTVSRVTHTLATSLFLPVGLLK
ncbi:MAG: hypothetical protein N3C59_07060 [Azovibrio sp.]|nr:hypothetical protein [Azovibrio sp.]